MGLARLAGVALGLALFSPGLAADRVQAFVDVGVIPMDREGVLLHQTVLVTGDRITALGPAAAVAVPPNAERITGRGRYLLPGLTDAHVHLVSVTELPLYLASGVTAVLNLHGQPAHLRWRAQVAEGTRAGPVIFSTGPIFDRLSLLDAGRTFAVFQWNARAFPRSANAEDSLAEAYARAGDRPQALAHYRAALERDPGYPNADFARGFVAAPSQP